MNPTLNRILILAAGLTTAMAGMLVLIGWQFDIEILKSPDSGTVSLKANAAIAFLLSGLTLILLQHQSPVYKTLVHIFSLSIAVIGLLTLSEYIVGWDLGIDEIIYREPAHAIGASGPGRMAPNAALNFALIGLALFIFTFQNLRNKFIVDFVVIISLAISIIGLLGFTSSLIGFSKIGSAGLTNMIFPTALSFIILCAGILSTLYMGHTKTMAVKHRLFAGHIVVATIIVFAYLLFYSNIKTMNEASRIISKTQKINQEINGTLADIMEMENGYRDFVSSADNKYLKALSEAKENLPVHIFRLRSIITHPGQKLSLDTLSSLTKRRIFSTEKLYHSYSIKGYDRVDSSIETASGEMLNDSIRLIAKKMIQTSNNILNADILSKSDTIKNNQRILYGSLFLQLFLIIITFLFVVKYILAKKKIGRKPPKIE